ncbi:GNAT family N-acetyltransferase [Oceanobacillus sp. 1P07AA]|uniref:GNAT family N-acetyltransferase n=1 Tax=Oceanobacillus sp. 1P07AA TaxID=3132293 RepID=UPI0039A6652B
MIFHSNQIYIREATNNDIGYMISVENNEENKPHILPWTEEQHRETMQEEDSYYLIVVEKITNRNVGFIILKGLTNTNKSIELVRIAIEIKDKGIGKEALSLIKVWAFNSFEAHRMWLEVKTDNKKAINLYKKEGFTVEGTLRECLKVGETYESLHVMSLLKHEFKRN